MPGLGPLAVGQLAAWENLADSWVTEESGRRLECGVCHGSILVLTDRLGVRYRYTHVDRLALIVLHLRSFHPHLDPN